MVPNKNSKVPYTDLKPKISQIMIKKWQQLLEQKIPTTSSIQPILKERKPDSTKTGREETNLTQLCIGHTKLTHSFILQQERSPKCSCGKSYTVKHIDGM